MIGIYMYENKTDKKKYIGQSINIQKRKWEHLNKKNTTSKFDKYLQKIGIENFNFKILEECPPELLDEREKYWIQFFDTTNPKKGYNLTIGGQSQRGENNVSAKLSKQQVLEIIKLLEENKLTDKEISQIYNVHFNTINNINRCYTWTSIHQYKNNIRNEFTQKHFHHNSKVGENSVSSKITEQQAKEIINLIETTTLSMPKIAQQLNISLFIVEDIKRCKTWKYLHNYKTNIRLKK